MGFAEVVMNLRTILHNIASCKEDIAAYRPDILILVDYPGFNMRIAPFAKALGVKVCYYISPQIWAWKQSRVHKIVASTDTILTILPFEKEFYAQFGYTQSVHFVGHPLLDAIADRSDIPAVVDDKRPIIALLPGSRRQEIIAKLPLMLSVVDDFPQFRFVVAGAPSQSADLYREMIKGIKAELVQNQTYALLKQAHAALVTSGTATLETALFNVPQIVCYKANAISYHIARKLVKVNYISLVNLVMKREVVKELIQNELTTMNLKAELNRIVEKGDRRQQQLQDYVLLHEALGGKGASAKAAQLIYTMKSI
jgi:lipid-A-disaccharide synthase